MHLPATDFAFAFPMIISSSHHFALDLSMNHLFDMPDPNKEGDPLITNGNLESKKESPRTGNVHSMLGKTLVAGCVLLVVVIAWKGADSFIASKAGRFPLSVAFIGNSMLYFNDFPRFFEIIANGQIMQQSCLHGGASISSLLIQGNAMYPLFHTENAIVGSRKGSTIYDYGACTVPQLLVGIDDRIHDPGYAQPEGEEEEHRNYNPCREDLAYLEYAIEAYDGRQAPSGPWNFVVINDNTRNPSRRKTRARALQDIERFYVPWFLETGATPVFLWTHAYSVNSTSDRNMTGLEDVANFTSLTRVGYQAYADLLKLYLPKAQEPRIAPVGLAFLVVYEENPDIWHSLFHNADHLHASPSGSFLQGCIVYYTIFGRMPDREVVIQEDMSVLWKRARMMQHPWEPPNPFPDSKTADYLYRVAERVMVEGYVPSSFINYQNGETVYGQE